MTLSDSTARSPTPLLSMDRRALLRFGGFGALALLAGCGTMRPTGESGGSSAAASGIVSGIRSGAGLTALSPDAQLEQAALQQARYMASAGRMEHTTGWGKDFAARVSDNGIKGAAAENIAQGRMDLTRLFDMWMNSPPHRRNMLDPRFTRFGLAYVGDASRPGWRYWALGLGK